MGELPEWFEEAEYGDWPLYILAARAGTIDYLPDAMGHYRMHEDGYWSKLTEIERHRMTLGFLQRLERNLDPLLLRDVRTSIAVLEYLLAAEAERSGDRRAARSAARRRIARRLSPPRKWSTLGLLARTYTAILRRTGGGVRRRLATARDAPRR